MISVLSYFYEIINLLMKRIPCFQIKLKEIKKEMPES